MHCNGDKAYINRIENLIVGTGNYLLLKDRKGMSARYTQYYLVFFHKKDARKASKSLFPWMITHVSVHLTYDERVDAENTGSVFINLFDFNQLIALLPGVGKIIWRMRQELQQRQEVFCDYKLAPQKIQKK